MATKDEYEELLEDRPTKFDPKDVHFHKANAGEPMCAACIHWYRGLRHDVCEIQRPSDEQVPWNHTCIFQTSDWENYPLYKADDAKSVREDGDENS